MRPFIIILSLFTILSCHNASTSNVSKISNVPSNCLPGRDTVQIVISFVKDSLKTPTVNFYSIVNLILKKGGFKPQLDDNDRLKLTQKVALIFPVAYDTCNMQRFVNKFFILKNMRVSSCDFNAVRPEKKTKNLIAGLHFEEWKFANNKDRDSAYKIVNLIYNYPNNIVAYEKRYSQFIINDKTIFVLEARAKFSEQYAIDYAKIIQAFCGADK